MCFWEFLKIQKNQKWKARQKFREMQGEGNLANKGFPETNLVTATRSVSLLSRITMTGRLFWSSVLARIDDVLCTCQSACLRRSRNGQSVDVAEFAFAVDEMYRAWKSIDWIGKFPFYDVCFLFKLGSKLESDVIPGERSQSDITLSALVVLSSDKATPRAVCASGNAVTLGRWIPTHFWLSNVTHPKFSPNQNSPTLSVWWKV